MCLAAVIAVISPFAMVIGAVALTPSQYSNTFVGALNEKYDRLTSIDGPKLVVVGGSSVAFGVDSAMIEKYTGMPVVNFGLYAALGTKLMLDLSRSAVGKGDVIVLSPELDPQTLSLYFSADQTFTALDDDYSMFAGIGEDNKLSMLGGLFRFATEKIALMLSGQVIDPEGVYNAENFDERGDLTYVRESNVMDVYYDPNKLIKLSEEILDPEFIDYVNEYVAYCESRGATVLFAYCPMNERAVEQPYKQSENNIRARQEFHDYLSSVLDCEVIGNVEDAILDAAYFYDTNFHLNDAGRTLRTIALTKDILFALDKPVAVLEVEPGKPALPDSDTRYFGVDPNSEYFRFEERENGTYAIVGLSYSGRKELTLTVPLGFNGKKVTAISEKAFSGGIVEKVIIPADSNIRIIENGGFASASSLKSLYIYYEKADSLIPPADFFGTHDDFRIYVPEGSSYNVDYNWVEVAGIKRILKFMGE